ncbi:MAG: hypothetical protein WDO71_22650 [Bacteroidota bacterium]
MRWPFLLLIVLIVSCKSPTEHEKIRGVLTGKWLILHPDHQLKNDRQTELYSRMQDSIVGLTGLKLIILSEDGSFQQMDSVGMKGKWAVSPDKVVYIEKGGKGFENFTTRITRYKKGIMHLTEMVQAEGETIKLVWNLKKITGGNAADLFSAESNEWRKRPDQPELEVQIKQRLSSMLQYYSDYFTLVTKESSFFVPTRIILPLRFYQHAIGMKDFDEESFFSKLFFNKQQAKDAHHYLTVIIRRLRDDYPTRDNYVKEYAAFMENMAERIVKQ